MTKPALYILFALLALGVMFGVDLIYDPKLPTSSDGSEPTVEHYTSNLPNPGNNIETGTWTVPPKAAIEFCKSNPKVCVRQ